MVTVIPLRYLSRHKWVHIRELCGKDEHSVNDKRSIDAICLINRLLHNGMEYNGIITNSAILPVADRQQVLTAIYFNTYGPEIKTSVSCSSCRSKFDIKFSLENWVSRLSNDNNRNRPGNGSAYPFEASDGTKFRLPTGEDEMSVSGLEPDIAEKELLKRCMPEETSDYNHESLVHAMEEAAPLTIGDIEAQCPECSVVQMFHFNLQQYLLSSLIIERDRLVAEIHLLARYYGWGLEEILELPRSMRRSFVISAGAS